MHTHSMSVAVQTRISFARDGSCCKRMFSDPTRRAHDSQSNVHQSKGERRPRSMSMALPCWGVVQIQAIPHARLGWRGLRWLVSPHQPSRWFGSFDRLQPHLVKNTKRSMFARPPAIDWQIDPIHVAAIYLTISPGPERCVSYVSSRTSRTLFLPR